MAWNIFETLSLPASVIILIAAGGIMLLVIAVLTLLSGQYSLDNIKSRTVGDGQHGTARWATNKEIKNSQEN